jgi:hypothetical protein
MPFRFRFTLPPAAAFRFRLIFFLPSGRFFQPYLNIMQKLFISIALLLCCMGSLSACDMCGCASGAGYFGILPLYQSNFIGLRYQYSRYLSRPLPSILGNEAGNSRQTYYSTELWGRFYPSRRLQILADVPYKTNLQEENGSRYRISGLGDISVIADYALINSGDTSNSNALQQLLQLGGGVKAPTGDFNTIPEGQDLSPGIQNGTGSWDFLLNAIYTLRYKSMGLSADMTLKHNSFNANDLKFGDRLSSSLKAFYWKKKGQFSFLPNAGLLYDYGKTDIQNNFYQEYSGGYSLCSVLGMDVYYKKVSLGLTWQQPLSQYLSLGYVQSGPRCLLDFTLKI